MEDGSERKISSWDKKKLALVLRCVMYIKLIADIQKKFGEKTEATLAILDSTKELIVVGKAKASVDEKDKKVYLDFFRVKDQQEEGEILKYLKELSCPPNIWISFGQPFYYCLG